MLNEDFIKRSVALAKLGGVSIDEWDLRLMRQWLNVMFEKGTDGIKITTGPEQDTWLVRLV